MDKLTRREMLQRTALTGSAALLSSLFYEHSALAGINPFLPVSGDPGKLSYFAAEEVAFLNAAVERLIPSDNLGPGAREAGVVYFIDQQMAGSFGRAERWYMQGPWQPGAKEQGYQLRFTPAQLYRLSIKSLDDYCKSKFGNKTFAQLSANDQDSILHALDGGKLALPDAPAKDFFDMLLQNTMEGFLADPMYGGNRKFAGWKLIGFPGPRYNYVQEITQYGKRYTRPTIGLTGYSGTIEKKKG